MSECSWDKYRSRFNPERKSGRSLKFTAELMELLAESILNRESIRSLAKEIGVPESNLRLRLSSSHVPESLGRYKRTFTQEQESRLVAHLRNMDEIFYGLTRKECLQLAYEYAECNKIPHRFNHETKTAGEKWFLDFCAQNNFSLRTPEKIAASRVSGFNQEAVQRFFNNLKDLMAKFNISETRIFNMDESGISTVPNKLEKVVSAKGSKLVSKVVAADGGETATIVCAVCPLGFTVPPAIIMPRIRFHEHLYRDAPPGTLRLHNSTGYMTTPLFVEWLKHFIQYTHSTENDPVLLILDNHVSHRSVEAIEICQKNYVHMLTLPPHTSNRFQPLDRAFFGPLKRAYSQKCANLGIGVNQKNEVQLVKLDLVAGLLRQAYNSTATPEIAESSFVATGIRPFNPDKFNGEFKPASVSERPLETTLNKNNDESFDNQVIQSSENVAVESPNIEPNTETNNYSSDVNLFDADLDGIALLPDDTLPTNEFPMPQSSSTPVNSSLSSSVLNQTNNTVDVDFVSPSKIWPTPKRNRDGQGRSGNSKAMKSEVMTSSLYKKQRILEESKKANVAKTKSKKENIKTSGKNVKKNEKKIVKKKPQTRQASGKLPVKPPTTVLEDSDSLSGEDSGDDDAVCIYCDELFSKSMTIRDKKWIQCQNCLHWAHNACADVDRYADHYVCELCA